jgi:hypothetical protein
VTDSELLQLQNENLKLKIQLRTVGAESDKPRLALWTAIASSIIAPIVLAVIQILLHRYEAEDREKATAKIETKVDAVDAKADVAATASVALTKTADAIAHDTALSTAINTNYEARRTGEPEDMAKAERAEAKVMAQKQEPSVPK